MSPLCAALFSAYLLLGAAEIPDKEIFFRDTFEGKLAEGWTWLREAPAAWRVENHALRLQVLPGNLWGPANNARNVLVRPLPAVKDAPICIGVTVENNPSSQYEQVNLVWFYDVHNMVKIGLELVDGQRCLVMGREENDKTQTIAKPPVDETSLHLRLIAEGGRVRGEYRSARFDWKVAGECTLPANGPAQVSLHAYQGAPDGQHWAKLSDFFISRPDKDLK